MPVDICLSLLYKNSRLSLKNIYHYTFLIIRKTWLQLKWVYNLNVNKYRFYIMKYISLNIIHFPWFYSANLLFPFFTIWINNFNAQTIFGCMVYYLYGKSPIFWNQLCFLSRCPLPLSEVVTEQVIRHRMIIRAQSFKLLVFVRLNYKFFASVWQVTIHKSHEL